MRWQTCMNTNCKRLKPVSAYLFHARVLHALFPPACLSFSNSAYLPISSSLKSQARILDGT
jgi:hypothetical protein